MAYHYEFDGVPRAHEKSKKSIEYGKELDISFVNVDHPYKLIFGDMIVLNIMLSFLEMRDPSFLPMWRKRVYETLVGGKLLIDGPGSEVVIKFEPDPDMEWFDFEGFLRYVYGYLEISVRIYDHLHEQLYGEEARDIDYDDEKMMRYVKTGVQTMKKFDKLVFDDHALTGFMAAQKGAGD